MLSTEKHWHHSAANKYTFAFLRVFSPSLVTHS